MTDQESLDTNAESAEAAEAERLRIKDTVIALALEMSESTEAFPFPGIKPEVYEQLKAEQEEYPGYVTPIDELLVRFQNEGVKIVLTKDPSAGDFMLLPGGSDDILNDQLMPSNLSLDGDIDTTLYELLSRKELIKKKRGGSRAPAAEKVAAVPTDLETTLKELARIDKENAGGIDEFETSRYAAVVELGYEVESNEGKWLTLAKDGYKIQLKHFPDGNNRFYEKGKLSMIEIRKGDEYVLFDKGWVQEPLSDQTKQIFEELVAALN